MDAFNVTLDNGKTTPFRSVLNFGSPGLCQPRPFERLWQDTRMARLVVVVERHDNPATSWPGHPLRVERLLNMLAQSRKHGTLEKTTFIVLF